MDFTGTGNSLNVVHPSVLRLIMDSLRYWVIECHVDGFRFDLASRARARALRRRPPVGVLRRHPPGPDPLPGQADRRAVGRRPGRLPGRQLPRAVVGVERHLPRHDARLLARRGRRRRVRPPPDRLAATSTRTTAGARSPRSTSSPRTTASRCATSSPTTSKHNEANQEDNRDGTDDNRSWNCGVEGETDDPEINALRERQQRNFLATLLLSQGTPMLLGGDEIARTQGGNNNAWCQDNEISWFDWELDERERAPARVHQAADRAAPRAPGVPPARLPHRRGRRGLRAARRVVVPPRRPAMTQRDWSTRRARARPVPQRRGDRRAGPEGERVEDDSFLLLFNASPEDVRLHAAEPALRRALGARVRHRRPGRRGGRAHRRRAASS